jgi:lipid-A-disaccharide synthase
MKIFISAGEPSGDLHAANLAAMLQQLRPGTECVGFGGARMEAAGCRLIYPLTQLAIVGFLPVLAHAHQFLKVLSQADRYFRHRRPDAVVLVDFPGFNWWVARRAHFHGIPVFYFIPPQLWAWAGWRVRKMRRYVDHVLCPLAFEVAWYHERGVHAHYVGHPYFDELANQRIDEEFMRSQRAGPGPIVALLPGSRTQEVRLNLSTLIRVAARVSVERPDTRFLVACFKESHREAVQARLRGRSLPIEVCAGRTAEIIRLAHAAVAVSGSVGLELLYHAKPTAVMYRVSRLDFELARWLKTSPYISLVNLLARRELYPEFLSVGCEAEKISQHVLRWLNDGPAYDELCRQLAALQTQAAEPGACLRTADYILRALDGRFASRLEAAA